MTARDFCGYLWAAPWSVVGVAAAPLVWATGGTVALETGVLELSGGVLERVLRRIGPGAGIAAITLGHTVLAADRESLERTRPHERVHVEQYRRWGPMFPLVYGLASLAAWSRGRDYYLDNRFEREARERAPIS